MRCRGDSLFVLSAEIKRMVLGIGESSAKLNPHRQGNRPAEPELQFGHFLVRARGEHFQKEEAQL